MRALAYILLSLQIILFSSASLALETKMRQDSASNTDKAAVQDAYKQWTQAVEKAKGNPSEVTALYAPNAILLPTLSPEIKLNITDHNAVSQELFDFTQADIKAYFVAFTSLKNIHATTEKLYTQLFNDVAINTGLYTFEYLDDKGNKIDVPARFTFVYEKIGDKWLIINHHSSYLPEASH